MLEISETYLTISGEAPIIGEPVFLIRFSGCNLNCAYCDSRYASGHSANGVSGNTKEDTDSRSVSEQGLTDEIVNVRAGYPSIKVLLTGGEPLLADRQEILSRIIEKNNDVAFYIETNGSIPISRFDLSNCMYVVDLKTPSSGEPDSFYSGNLEKLRARKDCVKIVLDERDLSWVKEKIAFIRSRNPDLDIYLSPQWGKIGLPLLAGFILDNSLDVKISIQLHKIIWGENTRGV
jgi:7-carboxy-7-deazaguanine synthase